MKKTLILLLVSLTSFTGISQNIDKVKLDAYFDTLANNNILMGSVAIFQNNELLYMKSVGFVDVEQKLKTNENSKYRIGSTSKTFTAVMVFKAIEENRLNLNQTIEIFFPTIKNANKITIEQLLYHRSGIHDFTARNWLKWNTQSKTKQEMIEMISKGGADFKPDTKTRYSNSNFVLLSYILERIYDKPYSAILEEKIIKPIGLNNTYYGKKTNVQDNECNSYKYKKGWKIESETDMSIPSGAGGIVSTPIDLTLFSEALFSGKLVSENSLEQMKNIKENYGMGLRQMSFNGNTCFGHTGKLDGFITMFAYFNDSNISFAFTTNGMNYNYWDLVTSILNAVFNNPFDIPKTKPMK